MDISKLSPEQLEEYVNSGALHSPGGCASEASGKSEQRTSVEKSEAEKEIREANRIIPATLEEKKAASRVAEEEGRNTERRAGS